MKLFVFNYRYYSDGDLFDRFAQRYGFQWSHTTEAPSAETVELAAGYDYVCVVTTPISGDLVRRLKELGVKMIATRTIGYDHIDLATCREIGMPVSNATYPPSSVADFAILLMLMTSRKVKLSLDRAAARDYTFVGIMGRELPEMTVGVLGTGKIGATVVRHLRGFGCPVLACDPFPNPELEPLCRYVDRETLLRESDIVTLHTPATDENYHLIDQAAIEKMKDRAILINTARGTLVDTAALLDALDSGKLGAAGLDAVENEREVFYQDCKTRPVTREIAALQMHPNVVLTPHIAFCTDSALENMIHSAVQSCLRNEAGEENPWQIDLDHLV